MINFLSYSKKTPIFNRIHFFRVVLVIKPNRIICTEVIFLLAIILVCYLYCEKFTVINFKKKLNKNEIIAK